MFGRVINSYFFFSSRRRHTRYWRDWSSDVCSSDLANISHELKTPLNLILSAIQFLQSKGGDDFLRTNFDKYGDVIKENSYRMVRIINNLLDITKIDSGYFEAHFDNYNIVERSEERRVG